MTASKTSFDNKFLPYSLESAANTVNLKNNVVSEAFMKELQNFKKKKVDYLWSDLGTEVFCDGTVYTGSAGIALFYFMCSLYNKEDEAKLLEKAIYCINLDKLRGRRITFLCGDAGPLALATVISYKMEKYYPNTATKLPTNYKDIAQRLTSLASLLNESPDELLYGRAGYLYALLFVNKHIGKEVISSEQINRVIDLIIKSGRNFSTKMKCKSPMMWQWHDKLYYGGAHGVAGILYILLQARQYNENIAMIVKPTLDWLLSEGYPSGNFPSSHNSGSGDRLVQWCHGAPGFVPLCLLAHEIYEDTKYLDIAVKCGGAVWQRGLCTKGYSICHGVAGNAYTFIQLFQATQDPKYLYQACCFASWCVAEEPGTQLHPPDRPASLFEGLAGRLYLVEDMIHIADAKFPAYTL